MDAGAGTQCVEGAARALGVDGVLFGGLPGAIARAREELREDL